MQSTRTGTILFKGGMCHAASLFLFPAEGRHPKRFTPCSFRDPVSILSFVGDLCFRMRPFPILNYCC